MALYDNTSSDIVMPVAPMGYANGNNGSGFGWGGDGSFWIIILFLFAMFNGGWGTGWGNNNAGGMFPYMMNNTTNNDMQRGFDQSAIMNGINGINSSLANAEVSRCNGISNVIGAVNGGFTGLQSTLAANQMGLYQTLNGNQSDILQAMNTANMTQMQNTNTLAMGLQNCYSGNRDHMGRYSREGATSHMIARLEEMLDNTCSEREREAIRSCIDKLSW